MRVIVLCPQDLSHNVVGKVVAFYGYAGYVNALQTVRGEYAACEQLALCAEPALPTPPVWTLPGSGLTLFDIRQAATGNAFETGQRLSGLVHLALHVPNLGAAGGARRGDRPSAGGHDRANPAELA